MKSFGYMATAHPTAGDFLYPQLDETSCLIADVNMPGMTGVEFKNFCSRLAAYPDNPHYGLSR
jgi:FixJ family two-component response regulator